MFTNGLKLKIKDKTLAEESRIIKKEEQKLTKRIKRTNDQARRRKYISAVASLQSHRVFDVKTEARATHLARAFLKCMPYEKVEGKRKPEKELEFRVTVAKKVVAMVNKYKYGSKAVEESTGFFKTKLNTDANVKKAVHSWLKID